ncbi:disintegrin and metalloproteinase domain-containing protein 10-like [Antedon mediterranea]|uniref:disintegrin and metalloproteinase domain-containing protein 10-like n=1 Tax=Antedon mediterranea TaxID=105859 RepID=UPI003AF42EAC
MFFNYSVLLVILINLVPALFYQKNNSHSEDQPIVLTYFKIEYNDFGIKSEQLVEEVHDCSKLKVEFDAYDRHFVLQLLCDNKLFTPDSKLNVIEEKGLSQSMLRSSNISVYTGHLQGDVNSYAVATIHNNSFESILHTVNGSYIIEPNQTENGTIIYKCEYIKLDSTVNNITHHYRRIKKLKAEEDLKKKQIELSQSIKRVNKFQNKTTKRTHWKRSFPDSQTCSLHLVADHTFVTAFNGNMKSALAEMIHHAIVADKIFRSTDFNGDGIGEEGTFVLIIPQHTI